MDINKVLHTGKDIMNLGEKEEKKYRKRLKITEKGVDIDNYYFIEKDRINTNRKLFSWAIHLIDKNWMNKNFLRYFIHEVSKNYKIKIHYEI